MSKVDAMYVHIPFCKNICSYCDFTKVYYSFFYEEKYFTFLQTVFYNFFILGTFRIQRVQF